jgi:hypothetical protein
VSVERVAKGLLQFGQLDQKEIDFLIGEEKLNEQAEKDEPPHKPSAYQRSLGVGNNRR